jgi:hypothetical protein
MHAQLTNKDIINYESVDDTFRFLFPVWYDGELSFSGSVSIFTLILSTVPLGVLRGTWLSSWMVLFVGVALLLPLLLSVKG